MRGEDNVELTRDQVIGTCLDIDTESLLLFPAMMTFCALILPYSVPSAESWSGGTGQCVITAERGRAMGPENRSEVEPCVFGWRMSQRETIAIKIH